MEFLLSHEMNLRGPRGFKLFDRAEEINVREFFRERQGGMTIVALDKRIPINKRDNHASTRWGLTNFSLLDTLAELKRQMEKYGVPEDAVGFAAYQTWEKKDMLFSGRIIMQREKGYFTLKASDSMPNEQRVSQYMFSCPLRKECLDMDNATMGSTITFPASLRDKLIQEVASIPGNPHVDFAVYKKGKERVFYHNIILEGDRHQPGIIICNADTL
jgi:hypothetical protein